MTFGEHMRRRSAWLKSLKAGDRVLMRGGSWHETYTDTVVARVTPSGRIHVKTIGGTTEFNPDGDERGARRSRSTLQEPSPELLAEIAERDERSGLLRRVDGIRWREHPTATLRAVVAALDAEVAK
jgi:hypothetical protein